MTLPSNNPNSASTALAQSVIEYFRRHGEDRTKRLLVHRYPREWLEATCERLIDFAAGDGHVPQVSGRPIQLALVQPPDERHALKRYKGITYGSAPDWPVLARDQGGLLLVLCPPAWYEFLHESIRSNAFLAFDEGSNDGNPKELLRRMIRSARLPQAQQDLVLACSEYLLDDARDRRHDEGAAQFLGWLADYLTEDPAPSVASLRRLGLIPDDGLVPHLGVQEIRRRVRENLAFQVKLSTELGRAPLRFFRDNFRDEEDGAVAEQLRAHTAKFHYNLSLNDPEWRVAWPVDLTLDRVQAGRDRRKGGGTVATLRRFQAAASDESFEGVAVVHDPRVTLTWEYAGAEESGREDVTVYLDETQVPGLVTRLDEGTLTVADIGPGLHVLELRPGNPASLDLRGHNALELFVVTGGVVPFAVRGQSVYGDRFEVQEGRPFTLVWGSPERSGEVARWLLQWQGVSGADGSAELDPLEHTFAVPGGIAEATDFRLTAASPEGEQVASAVLVAQPIDDAEVQSPAVGSVAQALVQAGRELRADPTWPSLRERDLRVAVEERSGTHYWIRIYDGEHVAWQGRYRIQASRLLDRFERRFLSAPDAPWLWSSPGQGGPSSIDEWPIDPADPAALGPWLQTLHASPAVTEFLDARRALFQRIKLLLGTEEIGIGALPLVEVEHEIRAYAARYEEALADEIHDDAEFQPHHVVLALVDTVLFVHPGWNARQELSRSHTLIYAMAVSPTHPLRLLWLLQLELAVRTALDGRDDRDFNPESFEGLSGLNFPPYLLDFDRKFYRNVGVSPNRGWALYLPENDTESDAALSPRVQRELPLRTTSDNVAVSSQQIQNALAYYHGAHPLRDTIRFHYINAGAGEKVVEALKGWIAKYKPSSTGPSSEIRELTAGRMRFEANLIDLFDGTSHAGVGRAFDEYAEESDPTDSLLTRTLFSVQPLKRSRFERAGDEVPLDRRHIIFGSHVFHTRGDAHRVEGRAFSLGAWGLRNSPTKFIEGGEAPQLFLSALVPEPPARSEAQPGLIANSDLLHGLAYRFQIMSSVTDQAKPYHSDTARMQVIRIDRGAMGAIERMHAVADWVYIADAHIDVELFDRPGEEGRYILDYTPTIGPTLRRDPRHNYVVTTSDATQISAVIQRHVQAEYPGLPVGLDSAEVALRLLQTLNRLSGRVLLHVLGRPRAIKGVVGMALAATMYELLGLLQPTRDDGSISGIRLLVPVDDYFDEVWFPDQSALERTRISGDHADLLDVSIELRSTGLRIDFQALEVKNVNSPYSDAGLQAPAGQVAATFKTLKTVLYGPNGKGRRDAPLKLAELADLLDFHMRRSLMQHLGADDAALDQARVFRGKVHEALVAGSVEISVGLSVPGTSPNLSAGAIVHFDSAGRGQDVGRFAPNDPRTYSLVKDSPNIRYIRLGVEDVSSLLLGEGGMDESALRSALDFGQLPPVIQGVPPHMPPGTEGSNMAPTSRAGSAAGEASAAGDEAQSVSPGADGGGHPTVQAQGRQSQTLPAEEGPDDLASRFLRACRSYKIRIDEIDPARAVLGPTVWRFYVRLGRGQRLDALRTVLNDIGREMQRTGLLVTSIPNSDEVALDVPRARRTQVPLQRGLNALPTLLSQEQMMLPIGVTPEGRDLVRDLTQMPHMLVGGTTGAGKTMFLYGVLVALLVGHPDPSTLRLFVSTSKPEDFVFFSGLPQLETRDVISDAAEALHFLQTEVPRAFEERLALLRDARCRDVGEYNARNTPQIPPLVVVVDEFADLADQLSRRSQARVNFYDQLRRVAQLGRSRGVHLVLCTQRPSVDLVPSNIRTLMNARVALHVNDSTASRMILDEAGAEQLQGHGDLLFKEANTVARAQGYFVTTDELDHLVAPLRLVAPNRGLA